MNTHDLRSVLMADAIARNQLYHFEMACAELASNLERELTGRAMTAGTDLAAKTYLIDAEHCREFATLLRNRWNSEIDREAVEERDAD